MVYRILMVVRYDIMLYCTKLYDKETALYYIIPYHAIFYYTVLDYTTLHYTILSYTIPYQTMLMYQ